MKTIFCLIFLLVLTSFAQVEPEPVKITFWLIVALLAGIWEVIGRLVPSVGQITIIGKIIEILVWISNFLNRKKKNKSR